MTEKYFYLWQDFPFAKNGLNKDWHIQTNDVGLAHNIRKSKESSENRVFGIQMYLFHIEFYDKEKALKSINTLLTRNNYPKLKRNADMGVFVSNTTPEMTAKQKAEVLK